jgi:predicted aspartyl protease
VPATQNRCAVVMRRAAVLLAALLACGASGARADDPVPSAASIRDKVLAAEGFFASSYRETMVYTQSNGETTTQQLFVRGDDWRVTNDDGPFHYEHGQINGRAWHRNENGQTILDQPDGSGSMYPEDAPDGAVPAPTAAVRLNGDHYVLTSTWPGYETVDDVDQATWHVVGSQQINAQGTVTTTYDDFRTTGGRTFAHAWHTDDRVRHMSWDGRIMAYDRSAITDDQVAIAAPGPPLVTFPPGIHAVTLPTQFVDQHILVRVTIGGRGLDFILDTGCSGIFMEAGVAQQLGFQLHDRVTEAAAQAYAAARTRIPEMRVGELVMRDVAVDTGPISWDESAYTKAVGLIGFDFLAELGTTIDYEHSRVIVVPDQEYAPPTDPHTIPLDVRVGEGMLYTTATINGATGDRWALDTGGAGTFMIFDAFARRHPDAIRDEKRGGALPPYLEFEGVGGAFDTRAYKIGHLQLGTIDFRDFTGYRVTSEGSYAGDDDGLIGPGFLQLFTLGIDYLHSSVYLVPRPLLLEAMHAK